MNSAASIFGSKVNAISQFERDGFQIIKSLIADSECDLLAAELTPLIEQKQAAAKTRIGGLRNLLQTNLLVSQLANSGSLISMLNQFSDLPAFPVRAIFFDKSPDANWAVPWHQDLAIAVAERIETQGYTGWSIKDETLHVHPPREVLENLLTMRLHLDDCDATNGALKVLPGTHCLGKLDAAKISILTEVVEPHSCALSKGDALLMRPLLLHSSSAAENPSHRRVLHIEYATQELSNGLKWFDRR